MFESLSTGRQLLQMSYREKDLSIDYNAELSVILVNETFKNNAITLEFLSTERAAANFLTQLHESLEEMVLLLFNDSYIIF